MTSLVLSLFFVSCLSEPKSANLFGSKDRDVYDESSETCHEDIHNWPTQFHQMEMEAIDWVNEMRSQEQDCRTEGRFLATHPLQYEPHLQCSSRFHSFWMAEHDTLAHESPDGDLGEDFYQRTASASYNGIAVGENVAAGYDSSKSVVQGWMISDGHCANIMSPEAQHIGVGYFMDEHSTFIHWWTLNTGIVF